MLHAWMRGGRACCVSPWHQARWYFNSHQQGCGQDAALVGELVQLNSALQRLTLNSFEMDVRKLRGLDGDTPVILAAMSCLRHSSSHICPAEPSSNYRDLMAQHDDPRYFGNAPVLQHASSIR